MYKKNKENIPVSDCVHVSNSVSFIVLSSVLEGVTSDVFEAVAGLLISKSNFGAKGFCFLAGFQNPQ